MEKYNIINEIGRGVYGITYEVENNNKYYALKKQKILKRELKKDYASKTWRELAFYRWIDNLSKSDQIYFMKMYEYSIDDDCEFNFNNESTQLNKSKYCLNLILDLKDGTLNTLKLDEKENYSLMMQMIYAIYLMRKYNWMHGDIHPGNIGFKRVGYDTKLKFTINNKVYKIPSYGYIFSLIDYGLCVNKKFMKLTKDKKEYKLNYELNLDLWCFLQEYCLNNYDNNGLITRNEIDTKKFPDKLIKYVYRNNRDLYYKIKIIMLKVNKKLKQKFQKFEKYSTIDYLIKYDFIQYVQIYDIDLYYRTLGIRETENKYNTEKIEIIKTNINKIENIIKKKLINNGKAR
jgi:serine/threonine protein kinase